MTDKHPPCCTVAPSPKLQLSLMGLIMMEPRQEVPDQLLLLPWGSYALSEALCCVIFSPHTDPWLLRSKSPVGNPQLIQFSREVIDLLKSQPCCLTPISGFIPSYHHHFAKQCRVSDYGYSKLIDLLEAIPHVLQVRFAAMLGGESSSSGLWPLWSKF